MDCLDLFECAINKVTPSIGFMDVYDIPIVKDYLERFDKEIQRRFTLKALSGFSSKNLSPIKGSPSPKKE